MAEDKNTKNRTHAENLAFAEEKGKGKEQNTLPLFQPAEAGMTDTRPAKPKPAKKAAAPLPASTPTKPNEQTNTRKELKLIEASALISDERPNGDEMVFTHTGVPSFSVQ